MEIKCNVPEDSIPIRLPDGKGIRHVWQPGQKDAILFAEASGRPLLVSGEPGLGKSQLAFAAAALLERPMKSFTINANTEANDLLYSFDAVRRLAESQVLSNVYKGDAESRDKLLKEIAISNFVQPGPLWWAIHGESALKIQPDGRPLFVSDHPDDWNPQEGIVLLIDEIDKAEPSLPNGLLEVFGDRKFTPPGSSEPIMTKSDAKAPVVIITTNEERRLPDPFVRRCLLLNLKMPDCLDDKDDIPILDSEIPRQFLHYLMQLGKAHYNDDPLPDGVMLDVAKMLLEDRQNAIQQGNKPYPGPAEYLDLLRALKVLGARELTRELDPGGTKDLKTVYFDLQKRLRPFAFKKAQGDIL
jgi:MoxR-like ATPase